MAEPKLSIIVPVHNVSHFLGDCLNHLVAQTINDIEIICVNDGSTDDSLNVLQEYAQRDSRIKIINEQENKGQAYARNLGLNIAQGEYIGFVDGDDWVEFSMFEKLYSNAKEYNSDIVMCATNLYNEYTQQTTRGDSYYGLSDFSEEFDNRVFSPSETSEFILDINVAIWNKIYKKEYLNKINARFKEGFIYEDLPFFFETYLKAERVSIVRDFLYFYRSNRLGSTMSNLGIKVLDRLDMVSLAYDILKQTSFYYDIRFKIVGWIIDDLFHRYTLVDKKYQKEFYFKMQKIYKLLDIEGLNDEDLKVFYFYDEFKLVKHESYEECNRALFIKYRDAKELIKKVKHERNVWMRELTEKYESKISEMKKTDKEFFLKQFQNQKEWFEKKYEYNKKTSNNLIEKEKNKELECQKTFYMSETVSKLELQNVISEEETKKKIDELKNLYEKEIKEKLEEQKQVDKEYWKQEFEKNVEEINAKKEVELEQRLEKQKQWFEDDFKRVKKEIDNWHEQNLEEKLKSQKDAYEQDLDKERDYMKEQKKYYEAELDNVRFALKIVKTVKKMFKIG